MKIFVIKGDFLPINIWTAYSRNKTILYAAFADINYLNNKFNNIETTIKNIVFTLAEKLINNEIPAHLFLIFQNIFKV